MMAAAAAKFGLNLPDEGLDLCVIHPWEHRNSTLSCSKMSAATDMRTEGVALSLDADDDEASGWYVTNSPKPKCLPMAMAAPWQNNKSLATLMASSTTMGTLARQKNPHSKYS